MLEQPKDKHYELIRERVERHFWTGRYTVQDAYTTSELSRAYDREDSRGRIRLLRRVYRQTPRLPYDLALKAVTDSDSAVREWMGRNGQMLDYRDARHESADALLDVTHPDRDLAMRLRRDSDPFVRATLFENPELFNPLWRSSEWIDEFKGCAPLERLAMMRNQALNLDLAKLVLDPDDTRLGIDMSERYTLAKACLANRHVVENGRRTRRGYVPRRDRWSGWFQSSDYSQAIWELAMKWPDEAGIPFRTVHTVQTYDRVKAKIYPHCKEVPLRGAIIESCLPEDEATLRLACADTDQGLRSMAYWRSNQMDRREIEAALLREKAEKDNGAMDGLFANPWLEPTAREILESVTEGAGIDNAARHP
jgi:hypothetical protein